MNDILHLFDHDLIPPGAAWSRRQQAILGNITSGDRTSIEMQLARWGMQAMDPIGGCAGLAYRSQNKITLLAAFLRSAVDCTTAEHPEWAGSHAEALAAIDRIDAGLRALATRDEWKFLSTPPRSVQNRTLNFHCMIKGAPAYTQVAARLQWGISAKLAQLASQPAEIADRRLGGLLQTVIPIVWAIPAIDTDGTTGGLPENFDAIVRTAILHMRRKRAGRFKNARYAPSSYKVLWNNWSEMFQARAREKVFHTRNVTERKPSTFSFVRGTTDEGFSNDRGLNEMLARLEEVELHEDKEISHIRRRMGVAGAKGGHFRLDPGSAVVQSTPSSTLPGSRPRVVLALIDAGLDALEGEWPALNAAAARGLIDCMLYLGRRPEWLLQLRLGHRPGSVRECLQPVLDPDKSTIFHRPDYYFGLSQELTPPLKNSNSAWMEFARAWRENDKACEQVDLVHKLILPDPLNGEIRFLLATKRRAVRSCSRRPIHVDQDLVWAWQERKKIVPLTMDHVELILKRLTEFIRQRIPSYPLLQPTHLCRTFEGHFAGHGLRPEMRFYISGRYDPEAGVALRYSRIPSGRISMEHARAANAFLGMVRSEREALGMPCRKESQVNPTPPQEEKDASFVGSANCARLDRVRTILSELQDAVRAPEEWDQELPHREALCNVRTRLAVVGLALLSGIRPLELPRLRCQDVDPRGLWIAVRGKARPREAAYRRIPILPGMSQLLEEIIKDTGGSNCPRRQLLGFYRNGSRWHAADVKDLEKILIEAAERQGLPAVFDLYGLRHRFRTDCLQADLPFRMINFLMGHETTGFEPYGIYQDAGPGRIQEAYQETVSALAAGYGWTQ
jgi:hypothetical protein